MSFRRYVVLKHIKSEVGEFWEEHSRYDGHSTRQAIQKAVEENDESFGLFVAVPEANFKPATVRTENVTKVVVE